MFIVISAYALLSITFSLLGCITLWKKYIYFSDGLSHASFLVIVMSNFLVTPFLTTGIIFSIIFALLIFKFQDLAGKNESVTIISNFMLALAMLISSIKPSKYNMLGLMFGDIIAVNIEDVCILAMLLIATLIYIFKYYHEILLIVLNKDIAKVRGINVKKIDLIFLMILSLSIFSAIKIGGALLVNTVLLLPPLTAKLISKEPAQMMILSIILSLLSCGIGLVLADYWGTQLTPPTVLAGGVLYVGIIMILKCLKMNNSIISSKN